MWRLHLSSLYVGHICIIKRPRSFWLRVVMFSYVRSVELVLSVTYFSRSSDFEICFQPCYAAFSSFVLRHFGLKGWDTLMHTYIGIHLKSAFPLKLLG